MVIWSKCSLSRGLADRGERIRVTDLAVGRGPGIPQPLQLGLEPVRGLVGLMLAGTAQALVVGGARGMLYGVFGEQIGGPLSVAIRHGRRVMF